MENYNIITNHITLPSSYLPFPAKPAPATQPSPSPSRCALKRRDEAAGASGLRQQEPRHQQLLRKLGGSARGRERGSKPLQMSPTASTFAKVDHPWANHACVLPRVCVGMTMHVQARGRCCCVFVLWNDDLCMINACMTRWSEGWRRQYGIFCFKRIFFFFLLMDNGR